MSGEQISEDTQKNANPVMPSPEAQNVRAVPLTPASNQRLNSAEEAIEERMSAFERSTVRLTKISIAVAFIVGLAVFAQWWEMHTSGVDTHALADAAKEQAKAAQSFAQSVASMNAGIEDAIKKLDAQVQATEESAKLTRHVIESTEAAVINPYAAPLNIPNLTSLLYGITINFGNTGKVNAVHFTSRASLEREMLPGYTPIGKPLYSNIHRDQIIPSAQRQGLGADQVAVSTFDTQSFTQDDIARMKVMKETFKIEETYSYGNGFGETVRGKMCLLYVSLHNPDGSGSEGWISCEEARSDISATTRRQQAAQRGEPQKESIIPSASTITLPSPN